MAESLPPKDCRGFFMLPQYTERGANGYYTYGTPAHGAGQYAHPKLLSLICMIEHIWQGQDNRKIGKDGKPEAVRRTDKQYDRDATALLIEMFFHSGIVQVIYFNGDVPGVTPRIHHDDHFHVTVKP